MSGYEVEDQWATGTPDDLLKVKAYLLGIDFYAIKEYEGETRHHFQRDGEGQDEGPFDIWGVYAPLSLEHPDVQFVFAYEYHDVHLVTRVATLVQGGVVTQNEENMMPTAEDLPPGALARYKPDEVCCTYTRQTLTEDGQTLDLFAVHLYAGDLWDEVINTGR